MNSVKKAFIILLPLAIYSCSTDININTTNKDITDNILSVQIRTTIKGKAEFPNNSPLLLPSLTKRGDGGEFSAKATITDVGSNATVSLITPQEHPTTPNKTIATGLTDNNGNFTINPNTSFNPAVNEIFVLEATRRIGSSGQSLMSIRTYIKWTGNGWISMTKDFTNNTYPIYINTKTTALSLIAAINADISPVHTIGTINIAGGSSVPINITGDNSYSLNAQVIIDTAQRIEVLIGSNLDPTQIIKYDPVLNNYIPSRLENPQKILLINTKNCPNCSLYGEDLSNLDLNNGDLRNVDFTGAILTGAKITGANFSNVNMTGIKGYNGTVNDFTNFDFTNTNLSNTTLTEATLTGAKVTGTNFSNVSMRDIKGYNGNLGDFTNFDFTNTNLSNTNLSGAILTGAKVTGTNFSYVSMRNIKGYNGNLGDFTSFDFSNANLSGADLGSANLNNAIMSQANLSGASLMNTRLINVNLGSADLSSADLTYADLSGANLSAANLINAQLFVTNLTGADLTNTTLTGALLNYANLSGARWSDGHTCVVDNAFDGLCD